MAYHEGEVKVGLPFAVALSNLGNYNNKELYSAVESVSLASTAHPDRVCFCLCTVVFCDDALLNKANN